MFQQQNNNDQIQKKIFILAICILFFISFIMVVYAAVNHQNMIQNDKKINAIEKNNFYINKNLKQIEQNIQAKKDQEEKEEAEKKLEDNSNKKNKMHGLNKDILIESENFIAQDSTKFPTFEKLVGLKEAKSAAKGFVNFLKNKKAFENRGKMFAPTGLMMYGTPGCGKTIFAGSIAKETELPFIEVSCSIFAQEFVGKAPRMVKELFDLAREAANQNGKGAIIFLDECENIFLNIDSLKPGSEIANVVNEFKIQLEPREEERNPEQPIFVIGATNHIDGIEPAILSRFNHRIELKPGNELERQIQFESILQHNQFPITQEAKEYLLNTINKALDHLPPQYEKTINGDIVEIPMEKNYKKAYRVLDNLIKEANLKSIDREITLITEQKECENPKHEELFKNNITFANNNKMKKQTNSNILENCCECKAINVEDLKKAYQIIIDDSCKSLEKIKSN